MQTPGRRRLIAGGIASAAVAGAIGTAALVAHGHPAVAAAPAASLTSPGPSSSPSAAGKPARPHHDSRGKDLIGRVQSVTTTAIIVVDARGISHSLTIAPRTIITGPGGIEAATAIPPGELVEVVVTTHHPRSSPSASATPAATTGGGDAVAAAIEDTGFRAA